ncbi:MAG: response regulator [Chloroflexota bacterium]|jgi:CheY-like chemotaxis protein|nr:response regulator [Chloroflexota bacterium]
MSDQGEILLVEDNPNDIELILAALDEGDVVDKVNITRDGEQALDYLYRRGAHGSRLTGNPKVVLLDLKLPKVNGLEVLHQIKTDRNLRRIPVVIFTSSREERDLLRSYDFGTNAYVVKPISYQAFVEAIKEIGLFWGVINQAPRMVEPKS